jgi:hypothetical protein
MTLRTSSLSRLGLSLTGSNLDLEILTGEEDDESPSESEGGPPSPEEEDDEDEGEDDEGDEDEDDSPSGSGGEPSEEEGEDGEDDDEEEDEEEDGNGNSSPYDEEEEDDDSPSGSGEPPEDDEGEDDEGEDDEEEDDEDDSDAGDEDGEGDDEDSNGSSDPSVDSSDSPSDEDSDHQDALDDLKEELENEEELDLKDNSSALEEALEEEHGEVLKDEQMWMPADPEADSVVYPPTHGHDIQAVAGMLVEVRAQVSALQSQLRSRFLQARAPKVLHGVRQGRGLSGRRLVTSALELRADRRPSRPDWTRYEAQAVSLATSLVIDQSSSMTNRVRLAAKSALAICSALDALGSPNQVIGFRQSSQFGHTRSLPGAHRSKAVTIDVFKDWDEKLRDCSGRFNYVRAVHYTPMSDGIQYGLQELNQRGEDHRVMLVLTDGQPDRSQVVRRQIRLAEEAGNIVIGIGIDGGCRSVGGLFKHSVVVLQTEDLPQMLLQTLSEVVFPSHGRVQLD